MDRKKIAFYTNIYDDSNSFCFPFYFYSVIFTYGCITPQVKKKMLKKSEKRENVNYFSLLDKNQT